MNEQSKTTETRLDGNLAVMRSGSIDPCHIEIAKSLMKEILYDNGYVDRWHPEERQYSQKWINKIALIAGEFFDKHPELLTNDHIEQIASGGIEGDDIDDLDVIYAKYPDLKYLREILDKYLNDSCGVKPDA